ncbi:hypothetical protein M430DRAFT_204282 [Amorphotheca resinae ATCC 22711]|jgi:hypothetical protein|uniref:Uncharacterized protein n=1 Tax=Amorphotheca resinae ATCC 22711 TaxID=857342 RepID=A0A2T3BB89_AMORE|nr:hypothetical protein M430DRAFT_204282 [Amorphotheca resinae ATCC 22711]PSS25592.1 hypothetical protein M430DRAFT_204282 [Amorphotheca resinae ATCC 22711]
MPSSQRGTPTDCAQSCMGHCVQYRTRTLNGRARIALPISPLRWQCSRALGAMGAILPVTARPHNPLLVARRKAREAAESSGLLLLNLSCYRIRETHVWRPAAYQNFTEHFLGGQPRARQDPATSPWAGVPFWVPRVVLPYPFRFLDAQTSVARGSEGSRGARVHVVHEGAMPMTPRCPLAGVVKCTEYTQVCIPQLSRTEKLPKYLSQQISIADL